MKSEASFLAAAARELATGRASDGLPHHLYRDPRQSSIEDPELLGRRHRKIDNPALRIRSPIVHFDDDAFARRHVGDAKYGPERQRPVSARHAPASVDRAARRPAALE